MNLPDSDRSHTAGGDMSRLESNDASSPGSGDGSSPAADDGFDIRLCDGTPIWLADPRRSTPTLAGLLGGLSRICRYQGHRPWTVLQHTWLCLQIALRADDRDGQSLITRTGTLGARLVLSILVHDLHEAVVGDIPGPMKRHLGDTFRSMEAHWERRIHELVGLPMPTGDLKALVKSVDLAALDLEMLAFPIPGMTTSAPRDPNLVGPVDEWIAYIRDEQMWTARRLLPLVEREIEGTARLVAVLGARRGNG